MPNNSLGETIFRCKVCGYLAKSGAGLTGHIQLAHGERASGNEELRKIGAEVVGLREDIAKGLERFDNPTLQNIGRELSELNRNLRTMIDLRTNPPIQNENYNNPILQGVNLPKLQLPSLQLPVPPPPPLPPSPMDAIVGLALIFGAAKIIEEIFSPKKDL